MNNPQKLHTAGTILIWIGVLVWAPYILQRIAGESPPMMAYLPFHLVGVVGGSQLRSAARQKLGIPRKKRTGLRRLGHWVVIAAVAVWAVYYGLKFSGRPVAFQPFLTAHLIGIFSGLGLMAAGAILERRRRQKKAERDGAGYPAEVIDG